MMEGSRIRTAALPSPDRSAPLVRDSSFAGRRPLAHFLRVISWSAAFTSLILCVCLVPSTSFAWQTGPQPAKGRELWAVVVAVDHYRDSSIPACPGATRGAELIKNWLIESQEDDDWDKEHLLEMLSATAPPTSDEIRKRILEWVASRSIKKDDLLVFYYCGQAIGVPADPDKGIRFEAGVLLPTDVNSQAPLERGIDPSTLFRNSKLDECNVVFWLDTSLVGYGERLEFPKIDSTFQPDTRRFLDSLTARPNRTAWIAADRMPAKTLTTGLRTQGQFTASLLDALEPPIGTATSSVSLMETLTDLKLQPAMQDQRFLSSGSWPADLGLRKSQLRRQTTRRQPELVIQRGHLDKVFDLLLAPDGDTLISAGSGDDSTVRIRSLRRQTVLRTLARHINGVTSLCLSTNGAYVASGDGAGKVAIHSLATGRDLEEPKGVPRPGQVQQIVAIPSRSPRFVSLATTGREKPALLLWTIGLDASLRYKPVAVEFDDPKERIVSLAAPARFGDSSIAFAGLSSKGTLLLFAEDGQPVQQKIRTRFVTKNKVLLSFTRAGNRLVAVEPSTGEISILQMPDGKEILHKQLGRKLNGAALSSRGILAFSIEDLNSVGRIERISASDPNLEIPAIPGGNGNLSWSADGRYLLAGHQGVLTLWNLDERGNARKLELPQPEDGEGRLAGGKVLGNRVWGIEPEGGLTAWRLEGDDLAIWDQHIAPGKGAIASLAADAPNRRLLAITRQHTAWLWELENNSGPRPLPGEWGSGRFLPDGRIALVAETGKPSQADRDWYHPGEIVILDRDGRPLRNGLRLPFKNNPDDKPGLTQSCKRLWTDSTGRTVAASTHSMSGPFIWRLEDGRLEYDLTKIVDKRQVFDLAFNAQGTRVLLAGEFGALVVDLNQAGVPSLAVQIPRQIKGVEYGKKADIQACCWDPSDPDQVVLGTNDGMIFSVNLKEPAQGKKLGQYPDRPVTGLTMDRQHLVARFDDPYLRVFDREGQELVERKVGLSAFRHSEWVTGAEQWVGPEGSVFVTSGLDASVKFWKLTEPGEVIQLLGSMTAWNPGAQEQNQKEDAPGLAQADLEPWPWVAYTPDGQFDGSERGAQFVRRVGRTVEHFDQHMLARLTYRLPLEFAAGKRPPELNWPEPEAPLVALEKPLNKKLVEGEKVQLRLSFDPEITDPDKLRLYQNGVPIPLFGPDGTKLAPDQLEPKGEAVILVDLLPGKNRFHAMASKPGTIDGRSDVVEVRSIAPPRVGTLHVVAIGVQDYEKGFGLQYSKGDAAAITERLERIIAARPNAEKAVVRLLYDEDVNKDNVLEAFDEVREAVENRPEDRVVVFLAGHTALTAEKNQFFLLQKQFPFREVVDAQGTIPETIPQKIANASGNTLAIADIYGQLVKLNATRRLVIIDACSAQSALTDKELLAREKEAYLLGWESRVNYIMGSRPNMPAYESELLGHGLLTYALLRGTGTERLETKDKEVESLFQKYPIADLDGDQRITTSEVEEYLGRALPPLVAQLETREGVIARGRNAGNAKNPPSPALSNSSAGLPFTLIELPGASDKKKLPATAAPEETTP